MPSVLGDGRGARMSRFSMTTSRQRNRWKFQNPESRSEMPLTRTSFESRINRFRGRSSQGSGCLIRGAPVQERVPERFAAALDGAFAGDAEMVCFRCVDQCRPPDLGVALDARLQGRIMRYVCGTFEHRALIQMQIDAGLQKNGAGQEFTRRNHQCPAAFSGQLINRRLDDRRIERHAVAHRPGGGEGQRILLRGVRGGNKSDEQG